MARKKRCYVDFREENPLNLYSTATGITAVVTTAVVNAFKTTKGEYFEMYNDGQNDQLVLTGGAIGTGGWVPPVDDDADSIEITRGINASSNAKSTFTVGTDPAFFIRVGGLVGTIARNTAFQVGFRVLAAYVTTKGADTTALKTAYNRKAMIGNASVAGALKTFTSVASGTDVETTLAHGALVDATYFSFQVNVSSAGVVTYLLGTSLTSLALAEAALAADASAVACTIDSGTVLVPSIMMLGTNATGINDTAIYKFECGPQ
jgi:hypothetical protein